MPWSDPLKSWSTKITLLSIQALLTTNTTTSFGIEGFKQRTAWKCLHPLWHMQLVSIRLHPGCDKLTVFLYGPNIKHFRRKSPIDLAGIWCNYLWNIRSKLVSSLMIERGSLPVLSGEVWSDSTTTSTGIAAYPIILVGRRMINLASELGK